MRDMDGDVFSTYSIYFYKIFKNKFIFKIDFIKDISDLNNNGYDGALEINLCFYS